MPAPHGCIGNDSGRLDTLQELNLVDSDSPGETSLGTDSVGGTRPNDNPCPWRTRRYLRIGLEVLGVASFLLAHAPIVFIYALGSDLEGVSTPPYWAVIVAGYLGMVAVLMARSRLFPGLAPRALLDTWLLAFPIALALAFLMVVYKVPSSLPSWNAHGMGANGGEANAALFPWLHLAFWILGAIAWRRAIVLTPSPSSSRR